MGPLHVHDGVFGPFECTCCMPDPAPQAAPAEPSWLDGFMSWLGFDPSAQRSEPEAGS